MGMSPPAGPPAPSDPDATSGNKGQAEHSNSLFSLSTSICWTDLDPFPENLLPKPAVYTDAEWDAVMGVNERWQLPVERTSWFWSMRCIHRALHIFRVAFAAFASRVESGNNKSDCQHDKSPSKHFRTLGALVTKFSLIEEVMIHHFNVGYSLRAAVCDVVGEYARKEFDQVNQITRRRAVLFAESCEAFGRALREQEKNMRSAKRRRGVNQGDGRASLDALVAECAAKANAALHRYVLFMHASFDKECFSGIFATRQHLSQEYWIKAMRKISSHESTELSKPAAYLFIYHNNDTKQSINLFVEAGLRGFLVLSLAAKWATLSHYRSWVLPLEVIAKNYSADNEAAGSGACRCRSILPRWIPGPIHRLVRSSLCAGGRIHDTATVS